MKEDKDNRNISEEYKIYSFFLIRKLEKEISELEDARIKLNSAKFENDNFNEQVQIIDRNIVEKKEELEGIKKSGPVVKAMDLTNGTLMDDKTRNEIIAEMEREEEFKRKQLFYQIKQIYKTTEGRSFDRFKKAISGKKPKWRKIGKLSQKELDFLLATYQGKTRITKGEIRYAEGRSDLDVLEKQKIIADSNWRKFTFLLRNHDVLRSHMVADERNGYYGRK